jgi:3-polyprenyl-4-hydroxybenzoate decarboxylase
MASAFRILGEGQLSLTKFLLVTDRHVDVRNFRATLEHILARTRPETDLYVFSNLSMDTLDYTGPTVNEGSKGVWMGLGDPVRDLPREFRGAELPQGVREVRVFCAGCLVVGAPAYTVEPDAAARIASAPVFASWPLIVVSDEPVRATRSDMNFLWTTFTRFEPAADIHAAGRQIVRNHIAYRGPVAIDARMKPWYPGELSCREDVASRVSGRWQEYFPSRRVAMGDSERAHLD